MTFGVVVQFVANLTSYVCFRDGKFEQEMEQANTSRFLNYRRYKEEKQKKLKQLRHLERLKKAQEGCGGEGGSSTPAAAAAAATSTGDDTGAVGASNGASSKVAGMVNKMLLSRPLLLDDQAVHASEEDIEEKIRKVKLSLEKLHVLYERDLETKVLEETGIR